MSFKSRLNRAIRYYIRYILQIASIYEPTGDPHIFIFSTRRGGSTLLRDMIYSQPGFNYIDEPFNFWEMHYNPYKRKFGFPSTAQITSIDPQLEDKYRDYMRGLLTRKYIIRSQWRIWDDYYKWRWHRYVLKDVNLKPVIPWIADQLGNDIRIVYQIRHPMAVAKSLVQCGWPHLYPTFLEDEEFCHKYVTTQMIRTVQSVENEGNAYEKYLLDWYFENLVPLRFCKREDWVIVSYEALVCSPRDVAERLCRQLELPDVESMISTIAKPSPSASKKAKAMIQEQGAASRLATWQSVDGRVIETFKVIANAFEIDVYRHDSLFPATELLRSGREARGGG